MGLSERNRWLLLIHQLPKEPAYTRVKVGRRLARVGAIALKNSVYVLPKQESAMEDFQWIRREILEAGGDATVIEAQLVEGVSDEEVEAQFREAKDSEYAALTEEARALGGSRSKKRGMNDEERARLLAEVERLERRVVEVSATDFFGASGREIVSGILRELRKQAEPPVTKTKSEPARPFVRARTWVTRTGVHVDRIASAWLIHRFIDAEAMFKFVVAKGYVPCEGELRFDMFEAEYSHEGDNCTFETLVARFDLKQTGLREISEIIHDIDLKETKFGRAETVGVSACITGICKLSRDDEQRIAHGSVLLEGLLASFSKRDPRA